MQQLAQPKNIIANNLNREMIEESSKFYVTKIVHASSFSLVSAAELALSSSGSSTLSPWGKSLHITKSSAEQIAEHFGSALVWNLFVYLGFSLTFLRVGPSFGNKQPQSNRGWENYFIFVS